MLSKSLPNARREGTPVSKMKTAGILRHSNMTLTRDEWFVPWIKRLLPSKPVVISRDGDNNQKQDSVLDIRPLSSNRWNRYHPLGRNFERQESKMWGTDINRIDFLELFESLLFQVALRATVVGGGGNGRSANICRTTWAYRNVCSLLLWTRRTPIRKSEAFDH